MPPQQKVNSSGSPKNVSQVHVRLKIASKMGVMPKADALREFEMILIRRNDDMVAQAFQVKSYSLSAANIILIYHIIMVSLFHDI